MDALLFMPDRAMTVDDAVAETRNGWLWLDCLFEEIERDPVAFADRIEAITGARIYELHLTRAVNEFQPSYYDAAGNYELVIFRRLAPGETSPLTERLAVGPFSHLQAPEIEQIVTKPIAFFLFERALLTVRSSPSRTIDQIRAKLLATQQKDGNALPDKHRLPATPLELMLRLINGMVDRYLDLRQPLTEQLDYWQRQLLDLDHDFTGWNLLLAARNELRSLESLCEEQIDAMQELRDSLLEDADSSDDITLIRIHDIVEHIERVHTHASRLQGSIETAVQLHFSAMSNNTNRTVQQLAMLGAVFAPLSFITGIFGMNFEHMPLLKEPWGFAATMVAMGLIVVGVGLSFVCRSLLRRRPWRRLRRPRGP